MRKENSYSLFTINNSALYLFPLTFFKRTKQEMMMKNFISKLIILPLIVFSSCVFAEKIIINRQPVTLQQQGEIYVVPQDYKVAQDYQYVTINGKQRACFLDKRPDFVNLDVVSINVQTATGVAAATWNCYSLDPTYFEIIQTK